MTGTDPIIDEARRILATDVFNVDLWAVHRMAAAVIRLAANPEGKPEVREVCIHNVPLDEMCFQCGPEGKPDAGVTEGQIENALKARADVLHGHISEARRYSFDEWDRRAMRAALASAVPAAPETIPGQWPAEITPSLQEMLGLMLWNTTPMAHAFRLAGRDVPPKTELEQAFIFHWLVGLYLKHGDDWRRFAGDELKDLPSAAPAVSQPPADTRETGNG